MCPGAVLVLLSACVTASDAAATSSALQAVDALAIEVPDELRVKAKQVVVAAAAAKTATV